MRASASLGLSLLGRMALKGSDSGLKATHFSKPWIAVGLLAPQLLILLFFFYIPSYKALSLAFVQVDPFGLTSIFVGLDNFTRLFSSPEYRYSAVLTLCLTLVQSIITLGLASVLGVRHRSGGARPRDL